VELVVGRQRLDGRLGGIDSVLQQRGVEADQQVAAGVVRGDFAVGGLRLNPSWGLQAMPSISTAAPGEELSVGRGRRGTIRASMVVRSMFARMA
jgi:hypothetical protein